jgi:serine/threonine protein kinase
LDNGRIQILSELGQGSFAKVYKAFLSSEKTPGNTLSLDTSTRLFGTSWENPSSKISFSQPTPLGQQQQVVAVKVLNKVGLSASQLQAQRNEIKFLKTLSDHPFICKLYKVFETETHVFMVLEICDTDLFDLIVPPPPPPSSGQSLQQDKSKRQQQGLPEPTVRLVFGQLASALAYAHSKGIYHRDLKPENVLILKSPSIPNGLLDPSIMGDSSVQVKLSDFGLATVSKISKEFGCGSVRYMSPECLESKLSPSGYSPEMNDVWSLAIILINLLTGKNPWVEPRKGDPNFALYQTEAQSIATLRSQFKLSYELALILSRVFSPDPSRRLSLTQFAEAVYALPYLRNPVLPLPTPPVSIPLLSATSPPVRSGSGFKVPTRPPSYSNTGVSPSSNSWKQTFLQGPLSPFYQMGTPPSSASSTPAPGYLQQGLLSPPINQGMMYFASPNQAGPSSSSSTTATGSSFATRQPKSRSSTISSMDGGPPLLFGAPSEDEFLPL